MDNLALSELMDHQFGTGEIFPSTWSTSQRFRALSGMGSWFRLVYVFMLPSQFTLC